MKKEIIECAAVNYDSRAIAFRAYVAGAEWALVSFGMMRVKSQRIIK